MRRICSRFLCYGREENAATAIEYGMLIALIAIAVMVTVLAIGGKLEVFLNEIHTYISSV
ncbi:MAG: Flp family type IVb pilin [Alphaproteobacteria bacterium]|nr:Flp family type IVb pilin [Alphaproteobacteria bacterium]